MKASLCNKERKLNTLKAKLEKTNDAHAALVQVVNSTRNKLQEGTEQYDNLSAELDDLEQYTRKNCLKIQGIPENAYSSTEEAVLKVAQALNVAINPDEI